ncbi:ABC transporter ATP-binding protein [Candidatus Falkowbacteria bacterium]|jgi:putative ABC transport system ATP-binding protein|nr:ABC transporter ATP-binding protein [Candidatus Falkowbacteria bacterium]MBT4433286.1 ABC transporter ATP-binding protein [Candidatus Falkowbacteria bacterium]
MLIKVENLKKEYCTGEVVTKVLRGLDFIIEEKEFVAIMGPSGSGKSTLMHILGFLDRATSGNYEFEGQDVGKLEEDDLAELRNKKVGFVFQSFNLLPRTTVLENVKLPLIYSENKKDLDKRAEEVLKKVGLSHRAHHLSNQLSGGEKQRVAIGRALINNPEIIFADEPTGNLDSVSGVQIMKILQNLNKEGKTVILVTHETYTSEHAKRIIHIVDGKIVSDSNVNNRRKAQDGEVLK